MSIARSSIVAAVSAMSLVSAASAATVYSESFDTAASGSNWTVNKSSTAAINEATFGFVYSTMGVPNAPGGSTAGLKLEANVAGAGSVATFSGLSVSPTGQNFTGDYRVTANVWLNFVGPAPAGGSGSTQIAGIGVGTAGTSAQWAGTATQDSVHFGTTLDGQSTVDYRAYSSAAATGYLEASNVFAAGTATGTNGARSNTNAYYAGFGGDAAPDTQTTLFPTQTGNTAAGVIAYDWHTFRVDKIGNTVTWYIDDLLIATVDASSVTLGGGNLLLNMYDSNTTQATGDTNRLNFALYDNLIVESIEAVPEPTTLVALAGLGGLALVRRRKA